MEFLNIIAVGLYSLGTILCGALFLDFVRSCRSERRARPGLEPSWLDGTILLLIFLWFLTAVLIHFAEHTPGWDGLYLKLASNVLLFSFPPMIAVGALTSPSRGGRMATSGKVTVGLISFASIGVLTWTFLVVFGFVAAERRLVGLVTSISISVLFGVVAILGIANVSREARKVRGTPAEVVNRRSAITLFVALLVLGLLIFFAAVTGAPLGRVLRVLGGMMPILFIFTDLYHANRFEFFDRFVKRGTALVLTLLFLTVWFAAALPILDIYRGQDIGPLLLGVAALPLAVVLPWLYRKLDQWVDSQWLGRRYTTVEAVKGFLSALQTSTGERDLLERAEKGLSTLFSAPTHIALELHQAAETDIDYVQEVPIRSGERRIGTIRMGRRTNQIPYFSEDIALLVSLADVFSYMLQNARLHERKQEQDQRANELAHQASLSELKALRAQINPHFLFNALNAIAGLIHKDPFRADSTVEQLAEVFRYTLRGSDKEWVRLEDEIEFIDAYLAVERARFGERLQVDIQADEEVRAALIPTMVVQTLVENSIKHGVASVRGPARIEVRARSESSCLLVEVADNGIGFSDAETTRSPPQAKGTHFGLKSIRERFRGYFGAGAGLSVERDDDRGMTIVRLSMPLDHGFGSQPENDSRGSTGVA